MTAMRRIAVYCGSASGSNPAFGDMAVTLGNAMAERGIDLVYGGGRLGLMGVVADTVLAAGGVVHGVIPQALIDLEVAHTGVTRLYTVANMHERKAKMTELADGFIALPGGIGTLDELLEAWTWNVLGYHAKPFTLLDVDGFWSGFDAFIGHVSAAGFLSESRRAQLQIAHSPDEALKQLDEAAAGAAQGMIW
jgi:hypothetical protein